jgi:serine/threonine protein phosphatase 1
MIDRGPDPVGVLRFCRDLAKAGDTILMGNHEDLMLAYLDCPEDPDNEWNWLFNGGITTLDGLEAIEGDEREELISWVRTLPSYAYVRIGERLYLLTHAGLHPGRIDRKALAVAEDDEAIVEAIVSRQTREDLLWIRDPFWRNPTRLVDEEGRGTVVVCGHTPTPYLDDMADRPDRSGRDARGLGQMVRVGACEATGGVADRWDIDAGCAGGHGFGRLLVVRLDDGEEFYEDIAEDE